MELNIYKSIPGRICILMGTLILVSYVFFKCLNNEEYQKTIEHNDRNNLDNSKNRLLCWLTLIISFLSQMMFALTIKYIAY